MPWLVVVEVMPGCNRRRIALDDSLEDGQNPSEEKVHSCSCDRVTCLVCLPDGHCRAQVGAVQYSHDSDPQWQVAIFLGLLGR